jgi:hypothetical protein
MAEIVTPTGVVSLPPHLQSIIEAHVRQYGPGQAEAKMREVADVISQIERGVPVDQIPISDPQLRAVAEQVAQNQQDKAEFQQNAMGVLGLGMGGVAGSGLTASALDGPASDQTQEAGLGTRLRGGLNNAMSSIVTAIGSARDSVATLSDRLLNRNNPAITDYRDFGRGTTNIDAMQAEATSQYVVASMGKQRGLDGPALG